MAETPWKPVPFFTPSRGLVGGLLTPPCVECGATAARLSNYCEECQPWRDTTAAMQATIRCSTAGGVTRTIRARRVWRDLPDLASRAAAPWWALVWVLTAGRMGTPLWRWEIPEIRSALPFPPAGFRGDVEAAGYRYPLKPPPPPAPPNIRYRS